MSCCMGLDVDVSCCMALAQSLKGILACGKLCGESV